MLLCLLVLPLLLLLTDKGEVQGVEEKHNVLALERFQGYLFELIIVHCRQ
jgi:hypothetical protein